MALRREEAPRRVRKARAETHAQLRGKEDVVKHERAGKAMLAAVKIARKKR